MKYKILKDIKAPIISGKTKLTNTDNNLVIDNTNNTINLATDITLNDITYTDNLGKTTTLQELDREVETNATHILDNGNNLALAGEQIKKNLDSIKLNTTNITNKQDKLSQEQLSDINNIKTNTTNISKVETQYNNLSNIVNQNTNDITSNTSNISNNTNAIANKQDILSQTQLDNINNVPNNTSAITNNTSAITINTSNITSNTSKIDDNTMLISDVDTRVTTNEGSIASNLVAITNNNKSIKELEVQNKKQVNLIDGLYIQPNVRYKKNSEGKVRSTGKWYIAAIDNVLGSDVGNEDKWVSTNAPKQEIGLENYYTKIETNTLLTPLEQRLVTNETNITSNTTSIGTKQDKLSQTQLDNINQVATNTTNIATKQDKLSTTQIDNINNVSNKQDKLTTTQINDINDISNKQDKLTTTQINNINQVATNTSSISTNETNITSNTNTIATHTSAISSMGSLISANESAINGKQDSLSQTQLNNIDKVSTNTNAISTLNSSISNKQDKLSTTQLNNINAIPNKQDKEVWEPISITIQNGTIYNQSNYWTSYKKIRFEGYFEASGVGGWLFPYSGEYRVPPTLSNGNNWFSIPVFSASGYGMCSLYSSSDTDNLKFYIGQPYPTQGSDKTIFNVSNLKVYGVRK